jgi:hypothetical protein
MVTRTFLIRSSNFRGDPVELEGFSDGSIMAREGRADNLIAVEIPADLVERLAELL